MHRRPRYTVLVAVIVIAVLGLLAMQAVLINMAYTANEQAFRQNVTAALQTVAQQLEAHELVTTVFWVSENATAVGGPGSSGPTRMLVSMGVDTLRGADRDSLEDVWAVRGDARTPGVRQPHRVRLHMVERDPGQDSPTGSLSERTLLDTVHVDTLPNPDGSSGFRYVTTRDSLLMEFSGGVQTSVIDQRGASNNRRALVARVVDRLTTVNRVPIEQRVNVNALDSLFRVHLRENAIGLDYQFGVCAPGEDSLRMAVPTAAATDLLTTPHRTRLFPADVLSPRYDLLLRFPGKQWYLLGQVGPYLGATMLFLGLIVVGFVATLRTIVRQERLSAQVREFINNMVHEFKTPLSTITLAGEAIVRPDVIGQRSRIRRYIGVVQEEAGRMKDQVGKILQMAVVEEGDYELSLTAVDLHDLLERVCAVTALQVEGRGGTLVLEREAAAFHVTADVMHLTNILHNVLDNALKYTPGVPVIAVRTCNDGSSVVLTIQDNGIGMTEADTRRVFEKYYRVPTGNVHQVKGFGLGLAYVRLMVQAMNGTVTLQSRPGAGSTVALRFPVLPGPGGAP